MNKILTWLAKERNISDLDRLGRVIIGEALMVVAYFWLGGAYAILCWVAAAVIFLSSISGFSLAYYWTNTSSFRRSKPKAKLWQAVPFLLIIAALPPLAGYYSIGPTTKAFAGAFAPATGFLKQANYDANVGIKELTAANFDQWKAKFDVFNKKYGSFLPFIIKGDRHFRTDLKETVEANQKIEQLVYSGQLDQADEEIGKLQLRWAEVFGRNGITLGNPRLMYFGRWVDEMENAAEQVDAPHILVSYPTVELKLRELEMTLEPSEELAALRQALENLTKAAQRGDIKQISQLGREFKRAFLRLDMK